MDPNFGGTAHFCGFVSAAVQCKSGMVETGLASLGNAYRERLLAEAGGHVQP
jgi:hypothetical protein